MKKRRRSEGLVRSRDGTSCITITEFEQLLESGSDGLINFIDFSRPEPDAKKTKCVELSVPTWIAESIASEAVRIGVTQQTLIKIWLAERLERKKTT